MDALPDVLFSGVTVGDLASWVDSLLVAGLLRFGAASFGSVLDTRHKSKQLAYTFQARLVWPAPRERKVEQRCGERPGAAAAAREPRPFPSRFTPLPPLRPASPATHSTHPALATPHPLPPSPLRASTASAWCSSSSQSQPALCP